MVRQSIYLLRCFAVVIATALAAPFAMAQPLTDGKVRVEALSDNFEDPAWSANFGDRWRGGSFRGAPEVLERVTPPANGLPGSTGALRIRSVDNGDDPHPTQEDFLTQDYTAALGRPLTRDDQVLTTIRVHMPAFSTWSNGVNNFGFRMEPRSNSLIGVDNPVGYYYPSIWLWDNGPENRFVVRLGDGFASDLNVAPITQAGWWTLGIGFDADGIGHYYASPGVDPLTAADEIWDTTMFNSFGGTDPRMDTLAYNFLSLGYPAGPSLSPDFIVDDFEVFIVPEPGTTALVAAMIGATLARRCRASL